MIPWCSWIICCNHCTHTHTFLDTNMFTFTSVTKIWKKISVKKKYFINEFPCLFYSEDFQEEIIFWLDKYAPLRLYLGKQGVSSFWQALAHWWHLEYASPDSATIYKLLMVESWMGHWNLVFNIKLGIAILPCNRMNHEH